jgi:hypothetical protein
MEEEVVILSCHLWTQKIENFTTIQSCGGAVLVQGNHISMASPNGIHKLCRIVADDRIFQKKCSNNGAALLLGLATS